jgi:LDH2 family malate/lactate/ureidoglycolate dehydrogenase
LAIGLLAAAGLAPEPAAELAGHLIWFDLAGRPEHGLATLPGWLERLATGEVQPKTEPRFGAERLGTAVVEAGRGPGPLALGVAARAAANKAREAGTALVRVRGVAGPCGPAAPIAAELAAGPLTAVILGPDGAWSLAAPTAGGPPAVADAAFRGGVGAGPAPPWAVLLEPGDWLIQAVAVPAVESLSALAARLTGPALAGADGWVDPADWEGRRSAAFERGLPVDEAAWGALSGWAERLGVPPPITGPRTAAAAGA